MGVIITAGRCLLLLLCGVLGYYMTFVALGVSLGMLIRVGYMPHEILVSPKISQLLNALPFIGGAGFTWFTLGRRYWKRRRIFRV